MQNQKTIEIQRLRGVAMNEGEAPTERIKAAAKLLSKFGPTDRNVPIINKVIKLFVDDNTNYAIKERALKLKEKLVKARGLREIAQVEVPEEPETKPIASDDSTNSANEPEEIEAPRLPVPPPPPPKEPDGFFRGFLNADEMVRRVLAAGYSGVKSTQDTDILRIALGNVSLDEKSAKQIWLTFDYHFKEILGGGGAENAFVHPVRRNATDLMPPAVQWILCSLCGYVNSRKIGVPTPDIFSFADDLAFRS